jgi:hypothetical protein
LASRIGYHTDEGPSYWAKRVVKELSAEFAQHDAVHMIAAAHASPDELIANYDELLRAIEAFAREAELDFSFDPAALAFRRSQLFEIIAPPVHTLLSLGRCRQAIELVAAWVGSPPEYRRRTPVLAVAPTHQKGVLYAVEGKGHVFARDTEAAMRRIIEAVNHAYGLSIAITHERVLPPVTTGRQGSKLGEFDELAEATAQFYLLGPLADFLSKAPTTPEAVCQLYSQHTSFQTLTEQRLGLSWPLITSFQEPEPDRPLRRVLLWSCGTLLGGDEVRTVSAYLTSRGVDCVTLAEEDLTKDHFLDLYRDESFDVIWGNAHGMYDSRSPHKSYVELSADKENLVTVTDLLQHSIPGNRRRLLMLNVCLGGRVFSTSAPAWLGMGAMLASRNQAVISHLTEVSSFVAPLFGALIAVGLIDTGSFFKAFRHAIRELPGKPESTLQKLIESDLQFRELAEKLGRNPQGVVPEDIRTWGTPVFYE